MGDDFVWEGRDEDLDWVLNLLEKEYELKNRGRLGFGPKDVRKIDILGRVIECRRRASRGKAIHDTKTCWRSTSG